MLIKLIGNMSGTRNGVPWPGIGQAFELPDDEALVLLENRMAVPAVNLQSDVETAVLKDVPEVRVDDPVKPEQPVRTDPSVAPSNEVRAEQRAALVKGRGKKVNPDVA